MTQMKDIEKEVGFFCKSDWSVGQIKRLINALDASSRKFQTTLSGIQVLPLITISYKTRESQKVWLS